MAVDGADNNLDRNLDPYHALHLNKSKDSGNKSGNSGCAAHSLATFTMSVPFHAAVSAFCLLACPSHAHNNTC